MFRSEDLHHGRPQLRNELLKIDDMEKTSLERRVRCYFSCSDELGD